MVVSALGVWDIQKRNITRFQDYLTLTSQIAKGEDNSK
jgi:hypothetical protein